MDNEETNPDELTAAELKAGEDPRVLATLLIRQANKQTKLLEAIDWKLWELLKTMPNIDLDKSKDTKEDS